MIAKKIDRSVRKEIKEILMGRIKDYLTQIALKDITEKETQYLRGMITAYIDIYGIFLTEEEIKKLPSKEDLVKEALKRYNPYNEII